MISALQPHKPSAAEGTALSWGGTSYSEDYQDSGGTRGDTDSPPLSILTGLLLELTEAKDWDSLGRESSPTAPSLSHTALCAPRLCHSPDHKPPFTEAGENLCAELPWTKLLHFNSWHLLWKPQLQSHLPYGDGGKEIKERKILPAVVVKEAQNGAVKETLGGGEELHLKGH